MTKNSHPVGKPRVRAGRSVLLGLLACAGCGSATYKVGIVVDPATASVYINGERVGPGGRRVHEIDFGKDERVCIQAVAASHEPITEMLTRQQIVDQINKYGDFSWVLKQER